MELTETQRHLLEQQVREYEAQREQLLAQVNALGGAVQAIRALLAPPAPPEPKEGE